MTDEVRTRSATGGEKGVKPIVFSQIPYEAMKQKGLVYSYGAGKYNAHNFRKGYEWSKSFDALCRHLFAFWSGEDLDPESGLPHMAHVGWHADVLVTFMKEHPQFDDRYKGNLPTVAEAYEEMERKAFLPPIVEEYLMREQEPPAMQRFRDDVEAAIRADIQEAATRQAMEAAARQPHDPFPPMPEEQKTYPPQSGEARISLDRDGPRFYIDGQAVPEKTWWRYVDRVGKES